VSKILVQSIFSIGRPHNDTCINASNTSSFNRLLRSLFIQFRLETPRSHVVVLAKPKLQLMPSRSCTVKIARVIEIWKCLLDCQDWSPTMFLFVNYRHCILWHAFFWEAFTVTSENFTEKFLWSAPPPKKKKRWPQWHMTGVEDFNIEHCWYPFTRNHGLITYKHILIIWQKHCKIAYRSKLYTLNKVALESPSLTLY
jgi:hypothetical protein